jgi:hypothetical protein
MATLPSIRAAATQLNRTLRAADTNGDGRLTKREVFAELRRAKASPELRSAAATAYAHQTFVDGDLFVAPTASLKRITDTVTANAKALVELDGKKRGSVKDGVIEQKELYASTNNLSRSLLTLANAD